MGKHALVGKQAPEISLPNFDGQTFTFKAGEGGRPTALFFYPQSGTYGCTKEACQFRDALSEEEVFKNSHIQVIGISPDPVDKQKKFVEKHELTYPILSDEKGEARKAYHVSKGLMGLTSSSRVTFVVDADGVVKDAFDSTINYAQHHKFVQSWLKTYTAATQTTTVDPGVSSPTATASAPAPAAEPSPAVPTSTTADAETPAAPAPLPSLTPLAKADAADPAIPAAGEPDRATEPPTAPVVALDPAAAAPAIPVPASQTVA